MLFKVSMFNTYSANFMTAALLLMTCKKMKYFKVSFILTQVRMNKSKLQQKIVTVMGNCFTFPCIEYPSLSSRQTYIHTD